MGPDFDCNYRGESWDHQVSDQAPGQPRVRPRKSESTSGFPVPH